MTVGPLELDVARLVARWRGNPVELWATEYGLVATLAANAGETMSRAFRAIGSRA